MTLDTSNLSDAKRALLEKYMRGELAQADVAVSVIPQHTGGGHAPLSYGQQQLWLLAQLTPDTPVYNECVTIHLPGPLEVPALEQSLNEFIRRHESWRTSFQVVHGEPVQVVHPPFSLTLSVIDLRHLPTGEREAEAIRIATEKAHALFDLSQVPLLRPTLVRYDDEEHRLFLALHHIIFDGVAIYQVFLPELRAIYEAFVAGKPPALPELPIQYSDYARWQRENLQGDVIAKQLAYWKHQLADAPPSLELPTDHPRPPHATHRGSMRPFAFSRQLTGALKVLSSKEGVTLYMTLVAAFQTLLYRYTGQEDILTGTATAGRKYAEVQKIMGFFLNMLVLRTNLSGNPTFRALLQRVREVVLVALAHPDVPFEYLVKELRPERNPGQNPFFQASITLEPPLPVLPSGWTLTQMDVKVGTAKFDLYLELDDRPEGLIGRFMYNTDLFDGSTIERITGHWQVLLEAIVDAPEQRISDLPILTQQEQRQLQEWNATSTAYPKDRCVHQLFEEQVERRPEEIALIFEEQRMTYRELNMRANQLAHRLRRLGVGTETLVGLCMDRSLELVVSLLGVLKAGGAYVPLDLAYPRERLAFMLQDTQALVLLTQAHLVDVLPRDGARILCLDTNWETIDQESTENLNNCTTAENLAYVMYTSGSTGRPKGVEIRHRNINRLVFGVDYAQLDAAQTILHMAPISFDAATLEVWGALLHGARCVLYPERIPTPKSIGALARRHNVTLAWLTASLFNAVIDEDPEELSSIRHILTGGEALSVAHIRRALERLPSTQLTNGYGPTESTTFTTCYAIPRQLSETLCSIPVGRPIGNTQVYILDKHLRQVPVGVPGELYIGGDGLARGYFRRPELTAERFIDEPGTKLYKTGDLVRYLPDGNIEFLGRLDQQVKIRGFRIEPGEVEAVLGQHAAVREALVVTREDAHREKRLVAYVVPLEGQSITVNELRGYLKEYLPDYMIPSDFVLLDALPLTANGKVDYLALPEPDLANRSMADTFAEPTQILHYQLLSIWEELLQKHPIGIRDNFFDLGGHSLLAARLVARIEQVVGKHLLLAILFAGPTIEQVASALQSEGPAPKTPVVTVQAGGSKRPFFFLHGDVTGGAFYCFPLARHIGPEQPFYVLEPYRFDDMGVPPSLEEAAATHIEALRMVQPEGPYLLGGFCNGGLMAYEMARQLQELGQTVDLLVLVDPTEFSRFRWVHKLISRTGKLVHLGDEKRLDVFLRMQYLYRYFLRRRLLQDYEDLQTNAPKPTALFPAIEVRYKDFAGVLSWLTSEYERRPYTGKVTILWARQEQFRGIWRRKVEKEGIELHFIPGNHITCRTEHLSELAEQLARCIREA
jgi:amino acid adenylation domain-containing protein